MKHIIYLILLSFTYSGYSQVVYPPMEKGCYTQCLKTMATFEEVQEEVLLVENNEHLLLYGTVQTKYLMTDYPVFSNLDFEVTFDTVPYTTQPFSTIKEDTLYEGITYQLPQSGKWLMSLDLTVDNYDSCLTMCFIEVPPLQQITKKIFDGKVIWQQAADTAAFIHVQDRLEVIEVVGTMPVYKKVEILVPNRKIPKKLKRNYTTITHFKQQAEVQFTGWQKTTTPKRLVPLVKQIQLALISKQYQDCECLDNILDEEMKEQLKQFQKDHNLPVGQLDSETLKALGVLY